MGLGVVIQMTYWIIILICHSLQEIRDSDDSVSAYKERVRTFKKVFISQSLATDI